LKNVEYPPAPSSELGDDDDILHEELHTEVLHAKPQEYQEMPSQEPELHSIEETDIQSFDEEPKVADELQPGGIGSSMSVELPADSTGSSLDSMTLKELKRLAEQRKIAGASAMRKQALIDALRNNVPKNKDSLLEETLQL
jgi:hypothetical protein